MKTYQSILFERGNGMARLTLNQPARLNSLDAELSHEVLDALAQAEADEDVRVLLLTGAGRAFCAGASLTGLAFDGAMPDLGDILEKQYNPIVEKLQSLRMPVVCAVNGAAADAGVNLALSCDMVIAARSARFLQAFTRIGLMPDMGGTYFLPRLIGSARAMALALLAEPLSAEQAAEWGMIWSCVDDDQLESATHELVQRLADGAPLALARTKAALRAAAKNSLTEQLAVECDLQRELGRTQDFMEGVSAFLGKRPARFTGR